MSKHAITDIKPTDVDYTAIPFKTHRYTEVSIKTMDHQVGTTYGFKPGTATFYNNVEVQSKIRGTNLVLNMKFSGLRGSEHTSNYQLSIVKTI